MMKKISAALLLILLLPNLAHSAPKLSKDIEKIANEHFFRLEAIELLYDKEVDYEKASGVRVLELKLMVDELMHFASGQAKS